MVMEIRDAKAKSHQKVSRILLSSRTIQQHLHSLPLEQLNKIYALSLTNTQQDYKNSWQTQGAILQNQLDLFIMWGRNDGQQQHFPVSSKLNKPAKKAVEQILISCHWGISACWNIPEPYLESLTDTYHPIHLAIEL